MIPMTISTVLKRKNNNNIIMFFFVFSSSSKLEKNNFKQNAVCCILGMLEVEHEGNVLKTMINVALRSNRLCLNLSASGNERCKTE